MMEILPTYDGFYANNDGICAFNDGFYDNNDGIYAYNDGNSTNI